MSDAKPLGLDVNQCMVPAGCDACHHTGYLGRAVIADHHCISGDHEKQLPTAHGLWNSARSLVESGTTSPAEVIRVLGLPAA